MQERDLEFFKGATRGPVERDYGKSATAEERAVVQVGPLREGPPAGSSLPPAAPLAAGPQTTASAHRSILPELLLAG